MHSYELELRINSYACASLIRYPGGEVRYSLKRDFRKPDKDRIKIKKSASWLTFPGLVGRGLLKWFPSYGDRRKVIGKGSLSCTVQLRFFLMRSFMCWLFHSEEQSDMVANSRAAGALVRSVEFHEKESIKDFKEKIHSKQGSTGYGLTPSPRRFTVRGRRIVKRVASALEEKFGKERIMFLTGTLPGSTDEAMLAIAQWSGYLMDRIQKWLRDNYSIDGNLYHVGVQELQARGALHYHALLVLPEGEDLEVVHENFRRFWYKLLCQLSDYTGVALFARKLHTEYNGILVKDWREYTEATQDYEWMRTGGEIVKKSVASYLSGYLSGFDKNESKFGDWRKFPYYPSRWWAVTRAARDLMESMVEVYEVPGAVDGEEFGDMVDLVESVCESYSVPFLVPASNPLLGVKCGWIAYTDDSSSMCIHIQKVLQERYADNRNKYSEYVTELNKLRNKEYRDKRELERDQAAHDALAKHNKEYKYRALNKLRNFYQDRYQLSGAKWFEPSWAD
jgi:hypothetical protein